MKINNNNSRKSNLVVALFCGVGLAGAFVAPPARLPTRVGREWGAKASGTQGTDKSSSQRSVTAVGVYNRVTAFCFGFVLSCWPKTTATAVSSYI